MPSGHSRPPIKAEENWSKLVSSHPSVTSYQMNLGRAYWSRAWAQYRLGHHADAIVSVDLDLAILDRLIKTESGSLDYEIEKASALNLKGVIYDEERHNALARATFKQVV
jgi:tetratricopeptide (TPR) repeat protein